MHDCRAMESRLIDLVFGELEAGEKLGLLAEVETCDACLVEYRSIASALLVFDQSVEASLPEESYWPRHQRERSELLAQTAPHAVTAQRSEPLWKRLFAASLPVPVPIAAAIVLALLVSSVLALRPSQKETVTAAPERVVVHAPPQIIEVPVVREKVIKHTIYVEKRGREKNETPRKRMLPQESEAELTARHNEAESAQGGFFTHANLTDFQPAGELRIRVIKRNNPDEN